MAANFWTSGHRAMLLSPEKVCLGHPADLSAGLSATDIRRLTSFFCHEMFEMTALMSNLRIRVATTACIYFQRFYQCNSFSKHDPRVVAPACIYLAGKAEENYVQSSKFVERLQRHKPQLSAKLDWKKLLELEMVVVQELDFNLLLFSAHHSLKLYLLDAKADAELSHRAWSLLCEAHCCHAALTEPPYTLALAAFLVAAKASEVDIASWLNGVRHDPEGVYRVALMLLDSQESEPMTTTAALHCLDILAASGNH